jgi:hypothetical protein
LCHDCGARELEDVAKNFRFLIQLSLGHVDTETPAARKLIVAGAFQGSFWAEGGEQWLEVNLGLHGEVHIAEEELQHLALSVTAVDQRTKKQMLQLCSRKALHGDSEADQDWLIFKADACLGHALTPLVRKYCEPDSPDSPAPVIDYMFQLRGFVYEAGVVRLACDTTLRIGFSDWCNWDHGFEFIDLVHMFQVWQICQWV